MSIRDQVKEFHRVFDQPILDTPTVPPDERIQLRLRLIAEEFLELLDAAGAWTDDETKAEIEYKIRHACARRMQLVIFADALADLDYVVEGTRLEFGIDGGPVADEVHRSNMAKARVCVSCNGTGALAIDAAGSLCFDYSRNCDVCHGAGRRVSKRADDKVNKPEGWTPPDIVGELKKQGWRG